MNSQLKITLYILLVALASVSGYFALKQFKSILNRPAQLSAEESEETNHTVSAEASASEQTAAPETTSTNTAPGETNVLNTLSNAAAIATGNTNTNIVKERGAARTNGVVRSKTKESVKASNSESNNEIPTALGSRANPENKKRSRIGLWAGVFVLTVIPLGILLALDISHFFGNRALRLLYNDEGPGPTDAEYELAEKEWANGNHLEAIKMMREYLQRNPREQHVALRIAEIYEKDLGNNLAAALEYEEVLKHKLAPERWGWAAVHLCNLYFKLNQEQKAFALLRRIVDEYPDTPAAEKARKRLEQVDGVPSGEITESKVESAPTPPQKSNPSSPASNLPPGFRPKK